MEIARPVLGVSGRRVTIHLAVGSIVTASTISQLVNKGVESVAVLLGARSDDAAYAELVHKYESRLQEIFGPSPDGNCSALLDALIEDGPFLC